MSRKQQFLLRWVRLDRTRFVETVPRKKGLLGIWIPLLEIFARDEKIIDPKDYDVDLRDFCEEC